MIFQPYLPCEQKLSWSCGPACLANAMALMGLSISQEQAIGLCKSSARYGTGVEDLVAAAKRCGFDPLIRCVSTPRRLSKVITWLYELCKVGVITAATVNDNGTDSARAHFILILGVTRKHVIIWDPSNNVPTRIGHKNLLKALWCDRKSARNSREYLVAFTPGSVLTKRASNVRYHLMYPGYFRLPIKKDKD